MTHAIYNEIETFPARWLENLAGAGHIAHGIVDTRSIVEIAAADVAGHGQRHFFAGIGGWSLALRLAGVPDDANVWTGSCPCQPFSSAGKRGGTSDARHLWPAWLPLIAECRPPILFGEQVASADGLAWLDSVYADLERLGYAIGAADTCAAGVSAPHARQRIYFVAYAGETGRAVLRTARIYGHGPHGNNSPRRRSDGLAVADADQERREGQGEPGQERAGGRPASRGRGLGDADRGHPEQLAGELHRDEGEHDGWASNGDHAPLGAGETRGVADAGQVIGRARRARGPGRNGARERDQGAIHDQRGGAARGVADGQDLRRRPRRERGAHGRAPLEPDGYGDAGQLVDTASGPGGLRVHGRPQEPAYPRWQPPGSRGERDAPASAFRNPWEPCDWIPCRDPDKGVVYRPVEPGTFPLAHGVPGRVGQLRAYGNAINIEQAATFIEAALDAIWDQG